MRFVLGLAVLTTLAVAVHGDYRVEDESQEENPYVSAQVLYCATNIRSYHYCQLFLERALDMR